MARITPAYLLDCGDCGRETLIKAIIPANIGDRVQALRDSHGTKPLDIGEFIIPPPVVICEHCGSQFVTPAI